MIRIIIADDHKMFIDGLSDVLKSLAGDSISIVAETNNGNEVLPLVRIHKPEVLVLDIGMPGLTGIEVAKLMREEFPQIPVLILTYSDQPDHVEELMNSEVAGYILKTRGAEQLVMAIKELAAGRIYFSQEIMGVIRSSKRKKEEIKSVKLTKREEEILRLIAREFTTPEIADKLFIAASTVETHRRNLIAKLGVKGTLGLVRKAVEMGLA
ncbi:MAG: response regulator transcription factor [Bacteroidia bacterium]|jgi:DNA-binding NarL/FixJ family response regulator|nr:response regulator transcription factor [Bacteroidia bacterium]